MNSGLYGMPSNNSGRFARSSFYGPYPYTGSSQSIVLANPLGKSCVIQVSFLCLATEGGYAAGDVMGEWMASFASCGYTIRFGRDQLVVEFAASVKGINKSTGASFTLTAGKWGVMVGAVG